MNKTGNGMDSSAGSSTANSLVTGAGKTVLVTGGGGGIGRELCRLFFRDGYNLLIVSLLQQELDELEVEFANRVHEEQMIQTLQADLALPNAAEDVYAFVQKQIVQKQSLQIDILVNNAGFGIYGEHVDLPLERVKSLLVLNGQTLVLMCSLFGKDMKQRGEGYILNVGSTISFQPLPRFAIYSGSKAMVVAFSEALAQELKPYGVLVSCLCPGTTATQFLDTAGLHRSKSKMSIGSGVHRIAMNPQKVAKVAYKGLFKGRTRSIPGMSNYLHFFISRIIPNPVITYFVQRVFSLAGK